MALGLLLVSWFTLVELNCENLFDCKHDSLKQDTEWLPDGQRRWSPARYWRKQNHIGQEILSCQEDGVPDLVALVEVENDSVLDEHYARSVACSLGGVGNHKDCLTHLIYFGEQSEEFI